MCTGALALLLAGNALADWELNMPRGVTELSVETYEIHMLIFWWCVAIAIVVFGAMIYSIYAHRKSRGVEPAKFSHSTAVEIAWTAIPVLILLIMAVPSAKLMIKLEDTRNPDITVVATGYQWRWHYEYQGEGVSFYSSLDRQSGAARRLGADIDPASVENYLLNVDNPLVVPRGAKVRMLMTSNDVLHSWWVPDLAVKKEPVRTCDRALCTFKVTVTDESAVPCTGPIIGLPSGAKVNGPLMTFLMPTRSSGG